MNTYSELNQYINEQKKWGKESGCFDISLFRCWIQFEKFLTNKFIFYSISSMAGEDIRKLKFTDEEHLKRFLKGDKTYIEYIGKIEALSSHIFLDNKNPFDILLLDPGYSKSFREIRVIRNHIAHESDESTRKYINTIFDGVRDKMISPNEYLFRWHTKDSNKTNYSKYMEDIDHMAKYIDEYQVY